MNNGQMDRGNENPTQHLLWWLTEAMIKFQPGWLGPGFELEISQIRVECVITAPTWFSLLDFFNLKLFVLTATRIFLVLDRNICWNHKFCSVRNDVCTKYSFDNQRFIFDSKILLFPLKDWFTMTINKSLWQTLKITGVELVLNCFSQGSFTWCVRVVSSPQNLVILPPCLKRKFITFSNYSPFDLLLGVYLKEYLSCDREFLPFFKNTHLM